ncbi:hypothetical protein B0H19DRAFT_928272 [Mycena capillaripes]|nr:hypothetical protein B0H19DRAFT_928272 [Mycena capillaripes]
MTENDILQKAESLWFSPDVVILRAETRIFRVFAAILKAQSSVFADMFKFPQPPSRADTETIDGFPVIELHDKPDEVEVFLKAIFDSSFFMRPPAEIQYLDVLGILRLSHKYDVPYLRRRSLEHLAPIYPTRLSEYEARADNHQMTGLDVLHRTRTLATASEVGALWLLPVVYYDLCKLEMDMLVRREWWDGVGEQEHNACLIGHSAQMRWLPTIVDFFSIPRDDEDECEDWTQCNIICLQSLHDHRTAWSSNMSWPLELWSEASWLALQADGLCDNCMMEAKSLHAAAKQKFWDQLPQMFKLPGWEELEELKRVALSA